MLNLDQLRFLPDNYRLMLPNYGTFVDSVCLLYSSLKQRIRISEDMQGDSNDVYGIYLKAI
jgi:hypothetical protein